MRFPLYVPGYVCVCVCVLLRRANEGEGETQTKSVGNLVNEKYLALVVMVREPKCGSSSLIRSLLFILFHS